MFCFWRLFWSSPRTTFSLFFLSLPQDIRILPASLSLSLKKSGGWALHKVTTHPEEENPLFFFFRTSRPFPDITGKKTCPKKRKEKPQQSFVTFVLKKTFLYLFFFFGECVFVWKVRVDSKQGRKFQVSNDDRQIIFRLRHLQVLRSSLCNLKLQN